MNATMQSPRVRLGRMRSVLAAACLLAAGVATAAAQGPAADWLWAAQTGPNLVTLTWQAVPGATEYQVYLGDPSAPGTFLPRPLSRLGANSRRASVTGMARVTNGIKLVAVDASSRVLRQAEFNRITPATSFAPPTPTTSVTAQATGPSEITVTWDPVPGATAYSIGRAVPPGGLTMRCALCPTEPRFVDRDVSPGLPHKYAVAAIFPSGKVSTRVVSAAVTPGETQLATAAESAPLSSKSAPPVVEEAVVAPPSVTAAALASGVAVVDWQPSPTVGVTGYTVTRHLNFPGGLVVRAELARVAATERSYTDRAFPSTQLASGTGSAQYEVIATASAGSASTRSNEIRMEPPQVPTPGPVPQPAFAPCTVEYQRANTMWASFGKPVGLGTESITLAPGEKRVFSTDWKYERLRNDGTNFYGSHLRIAANPSSGTSRLKLRSWTVDGLEILLRTGDDTFWIRLKPGVTQQFQADLMEVFCENFIQ